MAIFVFNKGDQEDFVNESLANDSISRFGWSYIDSADLIELQEKSWAEMTNDEISIWNKTNFLLQIKQDDWIIHVNTPQWGMCTAGKVSGEYFFDKEDVVGDFRHCIRLNKDTIIQFDRNDIAIHPAVSRRLKLQGHYWRLRYEKEFFDSMSNLENPGKFKQSIDSKGLLYLKREITPLLEKITEKTHLTHPEKKLEYLICEVFKNVPNVTDAYVNGSGWGTDFGADVVVKYTSGLNILNLQNEETLVIQVKSYEGSHHDLNSVTQLKIAIEKFEADSALLITTAHRTDEIEQAIDSLSRELGKPVALMAGADVAKFLLKYENGLLIEL